LGVATIIGDGDKLVHQPNNLWIKKNGRPARNAIVSGTAKGIAIHCPNEQRAIL
jgi:hypothetical protein